LVCVCGKKYIIIICNSGSQSGRIHSLGGDFDELRGEKSRGGNRGQNNTKGVKMLDH